MDIRPKKTNRRSQARIEVFQKLKKGGEKYLNTSGSYNLKGLLYVFIISKAKQYNHINRRTKPK